MIALFALVWIVGVCFGVLLCELSSTLRRRIETRAWRKLDAPLTQDDSANGFAFSQTLTDRYGDDLVVESQRGILYIHVVCDKEEPMSLDPSTVIRLRHLCDRHLDLRFGRSRDAEEARLVAENLWGKPQ